MCRELIGAEQRQGQARDAENHQWVEAECRNKLPFAERRQGSRRSATGARQAQQRHHRATPGQTGAEAVVRGDAKSDHQTGRSEDGQHRSPVRLKRTTHRWMFLMICSKAPLEMAIAIKIMSMMEITIPAIGIIFVVVYCCGAR